jgi:sterol desaturase/sphingolipid hydroxylase (fatty acid hydroxylase superfamily)
MAARRAPFGRATDRFRQFDRSNGETRGAVARIDMRGGGVQPRSHTMPHDLTLIDAAMRVFPNVIMFDGGRYVIATLVMSAILFLAHRTAWRAQIIQSRRPTRADYVRELSTSLRTVFVYAAAATPVLWARSNGFGAPFPTHVPSWLEIAGWVIVLLIVHDTYFYWTHRLLHTPRFFRRWHRTHHKTITPTPFTAYAFDWREALVHVAMPLAFQLVFGGPFLAFFIFLAIMIVRNVWGHCGTEFHPAWFADHWFWGWFTTTTHHDLHHSGGFGCNFGLYFTFWDRVCGTEHPRYREIFREVTARRLPGSVDEARHDVAVAA